MSELIYLAADALNIKKEDILKEHIFLQELLKELKPIIPSSLKTFWRARLCTFSFHVTKTGEKFYALGSKIDMDRIRKSRFKKVLLLCHFFKIYGIGYILEGFFLKSKIPAFLRNKKILKVALRCWPNVNNIDLQENKKCPSLYYKNGKLLPFCYYNIIDDRRCV